MAKLIIFCCSIFFLSSTFAQQTHLKFEFKGLKTPLVYVGYYEGGKAYSLDTAQVAAGNGQVELPGKSLKPGLYFATTAKGKLLDFVVSGTEDTLAIFLDLSRPDSAWSNTSPENEAYFRFEQERKKLESAIDAQKNLRSMMAKASNRDTAVLNAVDRNLLSLYRKTDSLALQFVQKHPNDLFARMLRSVRPPDPPKHLKPKLRNGKDNPEYLFWPKNHYWDNTDFQDESLLNNNFWQVFFDQYFGRYVANSVDSIIVALDDLLVKTPRNGAFYRFVVMRIAQYYEMNDTPGADRIFVHLADKYLKKDQTPWLDPATLERIAYKADTHRPNLTGSMAINFVMPDENGKPVELYEVKAPLTILIFYSPLCTHCMEVMPQVYQTWLDYSVKQVAAVVVNTDKQVQYWQKFIGQQNWEWLDVSDPQVMEQLDRQYAVSNLPLIYLLDQDKKILAKRVKPAELGQTLGQYLDN